MEVVGQLHKGSQLDSLTSRYYLLDTVSSKVSVRTLLFEPEPVARFGHDGRVQLGIQNAGIALLRREESCYGLLNRIDESVPRPWISTLCNLRQAIPVFALLTLLWPGTVLAQLSGHNTRGDNGIMSGSQAPVGVYAVGMLYDFSADTLRDRNGDTIPATSQGASVDAQAAVAGLLWTSELKLLGGNYGAAIYPAVTNNALELPAVQIDTKTSTGFADLYIQPLILGWTTARADFMAGLGLYVPTGRYAVDADDNRGLGMWSYEAFAGTTVYFDEARSWHLAATAFYETHSKKEGSDVRVGDIVTIEGGLGKSFMDGAASAGLAYYAQWKVSADDFGVTPPSGPILDKHRVYGIGPEVTLPLASKSRLFGFANLRYFVESGARSTLEGETLLLTLTFPIPSIPLQ